MVNDNQQYMIIAGQPDQADSEQRSTGQVERPHGLGVDETAQPARLLVTGNRQVDHAHRYRPWRVYHLNRTAAGTRNEPGAQRLVTDDQVIDRIAERSGVERSAQADGQRDVVHGVTWRAPVDEP